MNTDIVSVSGFIEGKILAEDVLSDKGALLVAKNTQINRYIKDKLLGMNVQRVQIFSSEKVDAVQERYLKSVTEIRSLLNDIVAGKGLDRRKLSSISDMIFKEITHSSVVVSQLNELLQTDEYTYKHSINVALYAALTAKWMNFSQKEIKTVIEAALLHDVGKVKIPLPLLNKKEKLHPEEFDEIKKHTIYGYEMVKDIESLSEDVKKAVLMHHEREDMSGYPLSAGREDISIYSKIVAVADVFDAMTTDRAYKKAVSPFDAFDMFQTSGQSIFDIRIVSAFLGNVATCYTGAKVLTDTGIVGKVVYIPPYNLSKPVISVGTSYKDLSRDSSLKILKII